MSDGEVRILRPLSDDQMDRLNFLQYVRSCRLMLSLEERSELKDLEENYYGRS